MGCGVSAHKINPNEIDLSHFSLERVIGRGGFGKVQACIKKSEPDKDRWYAIKTLKKDFILKSSGGVRSVYNELYALSQLQYVFLCNGHFAFQDSTQLYLVLDLALGGDLRYHLRHSPNGCFPEERARFYIIQLAMAVNYLHTKKMLHRDIKPDNILLCPNGYIKLTDMGIASRLENIEDCREVSGTRGYMAPEIYGKGHRHGPASDWFSVGVVLHEFLKGARPYTHKQIQNWQRAKDKAAADHKETPRELGVLTLGSSVKKEARAFCEALLRLDQRARLRTLPDALQHAYLKGLDAQKVERLELPAPFIPDVSKANVDTGVHDIEEAFGGDEEDKPGPVSANDQEKFKDYALNNEFGKRRTSLARRLSRSGRRVGATSPRGERSRSRSGRRGSASTVGEPLSPRGTASTPGRGGGNSSRGPSPVVAAPPADKKQAGGVPAAAAGAEEAPPADAADRTPPELPPRPAAAAAAVGGGDSAGGAGSSGEGGQEGGAAGGGGGGGGAHESAEAVAP